MCVNNFSPKINQALIQVENIVAHLKLKSSEYIVEKAEKKWFSSISFFSYDVFELPPPYRG